MAAVPKTLDELRTPREPREANMPAVRAGFSELAGFELAQRAAKVLSSSTLVPANYQGNLADCIVALELAQRIGASPLMVMQNLYIVHGKPAWSSQFLIAAVNQCGRYTAMQYEWTGKQGEDAWTCRAFTKDKATGERVQGPAVSIAMAKKEGWYEKKGSKWQTIPELMLMYRAATFFARTNAPELTMGLASAEEAHDVIDMEQVEPGRYTVTDLKDGGNVIEPEQPKKPEPAELKPFTDEVAALLAIDNAKDEGEGSAVLDLCKGQPFRARVVAAYNAKFTETIG